MREMQKLDYCWDGEPSEKTTTKREQPPFPFPFPANKDLQNGK